MNFVKDKIYSKEEAFDWCENLAKSHYENFPVGSILVPKKMRPHFYNIYAYSRMADDLADEGDFSTSERLKNLNDFRESFLECIKANSKPQEPVFVALKETMSFLQLPQKPFLDLVKAFEMDTTFTEYENREQQIFYCKHSANPVGKLVLSLFGKSNPENDFLSDKICTALQIVNFLQDISVDWGKGRVYIPQSIYSSFGLEREDFHNSDKTENFRKMILSEVDFVEKMFYEGSELIHKTSGRLSLELRFVVSSGLTILGKVKELNSKLRFERPHLKTSDKLKILKKVIQF
ncbi:MAG: squalene synthase HpnC [Calditrichaeota bacterium]|nr:MAG: squalene synthase HpnC [Calditrichota bacterium]